MDIEKRAHHLSERLNYIRDIFDGKHPEDIELLHNRLNEFFRRATEGIQSDPDAELTTLEELFTFMERQAGNEDPAPWTRCASSATRSVSACVTSLKTCTTTSRKSADRKSTASIRVCSSPAPPSPAAAARRPTTSSSWSSARKKGHGEEFRNGGSVKPWGNSKALQYMKVAETERHPDPYLCLHARLLPHRGHARRGTADCEKPL